MKPPDKQALRLATLVRDGVLALAQQSTAGLQCELARLLRQAEPLQVLQRKLELCEQKHLPHAARQVCEELKDLLHELPYELREVEKTIPESRERHVPSPHDILKDIAQIEDEMGGWEYDPENQTLSVKTEPITLEGVHLGAFEVQLHLERLGASRGRPAYSVVALNPNPPGCNEHVTHPHVSDDHLCEGDAAAGIHASLEEGRLCDFFLLVRAVLTTYNPSSPYVKLEHWNGEPCHDCGSIMDDESRYYCERCNEDFCDDCISYCRSCDLSMCHGCLQECRFCEDKVCRDCLKVCEGCLEKCCKSCLQDGLCPDCVQHQKQEEESHDGDTSQPESAQPDQQASEPDKERQDQALEPAA